MTTVLGMLGGVVDINRKVLQDRDLYQNFTSRVQEVWESVFPHLNGESIPFGLPVSTIPQGELDDFESCRLTLDFNETVMVHI